MDWESILSFTPSLVRSAPIQVNVICVVKWKTSFVLLATLGVNCMQPAPFIPPKIVTAEHYWSHLHCIQSVPTPPVDNLLNLFQAKNPILLSHFMSVRRWVGIERHCTDKRYRSYSVLSMSSSYFPSLNSLTGSQFLWNLNAGRFHRKGASSAV